MATKITSTNRSLTFTHNFATQGGTVNMPIVLPYNFPRVFINFINIVSYQTLVSAGFATIALGTDNVEDTQFINNLPYQFMTLQAGKFYSNNDFSDSTIGTVGAHIILTPKVASITAGILSININYNEIF